METILRRHWGKVCSAAEQGDPEAQREMGYLHEVGAVDKSGRIVVRANVAMAVKWYQASAKMGNCGAQSALSNLLSVGGDVARDFSQAIFWAKKAVAQGDASAAFNIGTIYRDLGRPALAFRWYERAASMGDTDAHLQIGLCHFFAFGTGQNFNAARSSFERILNADPSSVCQRTTENARYWISVLDLTRGPRTKVTMARIRSQLEAANVDDEHEQANELLNLVGKNAYLAAG